MGSDEKWVSDPAPDESKIHDAWFEAHYRHAAPIVIDWLGQEMSLDGAHLLDFGCGDGITTLSVALQSPVARVVGVDITSAFDLLGAIAESELGLEALPANVEFRKIKNGTTLDLAPIDGVFSWSAFEHIDRAQLSPIASDLFRTLEPGGLAFIQIEPLYHSAFGSHLQRLVDEPWVHLLRSEEEVNRLVLESDREIQGVELDHAARSGVDDRFKRWLFAEYQALNRLTADELIQLFIDVGFEVDREYRGQLDLEPPSQLLSRHSKEDLQTNEIRLLLRKGKPI